MLKGGNTRSKSRDVTEVVRLTCRHQTLASSSRRVGVRQGAHMSWLLCCESQALPASAAGLKAALHVFLLGAAGAHVLCRDVARLRCKLGLPPSSSALQPSSAPFSPPLHLSHTLTPVSPLLHLSGEVSPPSLRWSCKLLHGADDSKSVLPHDRGQEGKGRVVLTNQTCLKYKHLSLLASRTRTME